MLRDEAPCRHSLQAIGVQTLTRLGDRKCGAVDLQISPLPTCAVHDIRDEQRFRGKWIETPQNYCRTQTFQLQGVISASS